MVEKAVISATSNAAEDPIRLAFIPPNRVGRRMIITPIKPSTTLIDLSLVNGSPIQRYAIKTVKIGIMLTRTAVNPEEISVSAKDNKV